MKSHLKRCWTKKLSIVWFSIQKKFNLKWSLALKSQLSSIAEKMSLYDNFWILRAGQPLQTENNVNFHWNFADAHHKLNTYILCCKQFNSNICWCIKTAVLAANLRVQLLKRTVAKSIVKLEVTFLYFYIAERKCSGCKYWIFKMQMFLLSKTHLHIYIWKYFF